MQQTRRRSYDVLFPFHIIRARFLPGLHQHPPHHSPRLLLEHQGLLPAKNGLVHLRKQAGKKKLSTEVLV